MRLRLFATLVALLTHVACAGVTMNPWTSPYWVYNGTSVETDQFKGITTVRTPWKSQYSHGRTNVLKVDSMLRFHRAKGNQDSVDIYMRATVYEWMFLDSAADSSGYRAKTSTVDREVMNCSASTSRVRCRLEEHLIVHVPYSYLAAHAKKGTGAQWKIWGKRGEIVVDIPPAMIKGFVSRLQNKPPDPETRIARN